MHVFGVFPRLMIRQVLRLLYDAGSYEFAAATLHALEHDGYLLHGYRDGRKLADSPFVYAPTRKGRAWLADQGYAFFGRYDDVAEKSVSVAKMGHTLDVSDFLITTVLAGKEEARIQVGTIRHDEHLQREIKRGVPVVPDAFVDLTASDQRAPFFVELDRSGGESEREWRKKVRGYLDRQGQPILDYFGVETLDVLVPVNLPRLGEEHWSARLAKMTDAERQVESQARDAARMRRLLRWTEAELVELGKQAWADCFSFTTERPQERRGEEAVAFFTTPHWYSPLRPEPRPFVRL